MDGTAQAPLPTYFLGGADRDGLLSVMEDQQELCHNIFYLGKHNVVTLHGLTVGFVSGFFADTAAADAQGGGDAHGTVNPAPSPPTPTPVLPLRRRRRPPRS
eukprot:SAG11_NODE_28655_length_319_cov_0.927273_1_plen_102_part_01